MHAYFGKMIIPVLVYMAAILTMATLALSRKNSVSKSSFHWTGFGALLFIISDSLLAVDKFRVAMVWADLGIMATYSFAQLFIVWGIVIAHRE